VAIKRRTPEGDVLKAVLDCLGLWGIDANRQNTGAMPNAKGRLVRFGRPGDPDITGTLPGGRRLDLEVKAPGKRPTPEQLDRLRLANDQGAVGLWIDDAKELARILPRLCDGARVEIDDDGQQWLITDDDETEDVDG
jgi:hypothetical protein